MTVKEILKKYLKENGYNALMSEDCNLNGCSLDDNFMEECDTGYCPDCIPAYVKTRDECIKCGGCSIQRIYEHEDEYEYVFCNNKTTKDII